MALTAVPYRQVRALHTQRTITVYQAYSPIIAEAALAAGTFVPPFRRERMTWIKPSLLWMAYRSKWATARDQERVLAIEITHEGFRWALEHSCLSHYEPEIYPSHEAWVERKRVAPVRVQWDPERDLRHQPLSHRAIQIGLGGESVDRYLDEWIVTITDVTASLRAAADLVAQDRLDEAEALLPEESPYPLPTRLAVIIGATHERVSPIADPAP